MSLANDSSYQLEIPEATILNLVQVLNKESSTDTRIEAAKTLANLCRIMPISVLNQILEDAFLDASKSPDVSLRSTVVSTLRNFSNGKTITRLLQMLKDLDSVVIVAVAETLESMPHQFTSRYLSDLSTIVLESKDGFALGVIFSIQNRCKFYNYEIAQLAAEAREREKGERQRGVVTYNIGTVGNLNTGTVNVYGDQVGVKHETQEQGGECS